MRKTFLIIFFLPVLFACQDIKRELVLISGLTMGTSYSIKLVTNGNELDEITIQKNIEKILADINQAMSTYIVDSELSLFNQSRITDWQVMSEDLYHVIESANNVSSMSNGAFDITVGPLVNLWGFGAEPYNREIPSDSVLQSIKQHTGFKKLDFDKALHKISKSDPAVTIDLSGIAKGFAVDKIAEHLERLHIANYLVEIGGELKSKGTNAKQKVWRIGIEEAIPMKRSVSNIIKLDNIAMATSGDYRNYFEKDGVRYSHTIDPVTGKPINHSLTAVTVLHNSAMHADALATAFMVLGPEKSLALANEISVALYMIIKTNTGFEEQYNDQFKPYLTD